MKALNKILESSIGLVNDLESAMHYTTNTYYLALLCGAELREGEFWLNEQTLRFEKDQIVVQEGDVTIHYTFPKELNDIRNSNFFKKYYARSMSSDEIKQSYFTVQNRVVGNPNINMEYFLSAIVAKPRQIDEAYKDLGIRYLEFQGIDTIIEFCHEKLTVLDLATNRFIKSFEVPKEVNDLLNPYFVQHFVEDDRSYFDVLNIYAALSAYDLDEILADYSG